ncbi:MAG: flippase-like domain-containing protein [Cytophagales bacterium]|nr:flippase-like domain-containing protein [Cytophagales bacterium]
MSLTVALALLWYVYRDFPLSELASKLKEVKYGWVVLSIIVSLLSHVVRAYRWKLLLHPMGFRPSLFKTFLAVMVGYFSNLLVPRLGEVTRCGILKKIDYIPISSSLGTVMAERFIDLLSLIILTLIALVSGFEQCKILLHETMGEKIALFKGKKFYWLIVLLLLTVGSIGFFFVKKRNTSKQHYLIAKMQHFLKALLQGLTSIKHVKAQGTFWFMTIFLWILYFFIGYLVVFAIQETSNLGIAAGFSLLIMASMGMSAPVQGGIGTYHVLVMAILAAYGISKEAGILYVTLVHSSQMLTIMVVGGISFVASMLLGTKASSFKFQDLSSSKHETG